MGSSCFWRHVPNPSPITATDALLQRRSKSKHTDFFIIQSVNHRKFFYAKKVTRGWVSMGSELLAPCTPTFSPVCCGSHHNMLVLLQTSAQCCNFCCYFSGCCNLENPSFRPLFSHIPYISHTHRLEKSYVLTLCVCTASV